MKASVQAHLRGVPRMATEQDYQALEMALRTMENHDVDQLDGLSGTPQPPLSMLVHVGRFVVMEKRRVEELIRKNDRELLEEMIR